MLNITELKQALNTGDYGDCICDYDHCGNAYICDVITEIADNHTSIYYYDIKNFIVENFDAVEDAINEFGWDGCGGDLYKVGQMAEFLTIERDIYDNLEDVIKLYAYNYIEHCLKLDEITEDLSDVIDNLNIDSDDRLETITDEIDSYFNEN